MSRSGMRPISHVEGDRVRLTQIVAETCWNNAAKYTTRPGPYLADFGTAHTTARVVWRCRDDGAWHSPNRVCHIFSTCFTRLIRSFSQAEGGLRALALTLVRRLVEMHGGSVGAKSGGKATAQRRVYAVGFAGACQTFANR